MGGAGFVQLVARQANTAVFNMEGLALGARTAAAMEAFLEAQNPLIPAAEVLTFVATNFTGVAANTCGTTIP